MYVINFKDGRKISVDDFRCNANGTVEYIERWAQKIREIPQDSIANIEHKTISFGESLRKLSESKFYSVAKKYI